MVPNMSQNAPEPLQDVFKCAWGPPKDALFRRSFFIPAKMELAADEKSKSYRRNCTRRAASPSYTPPPNSLSSIFPPFHLLTPLFPLPTSA